VTNSPEDVKKVSLDTWSRTPWYPA